MVTRRFAAALVVSLLAGLGPAGGAERPKEHEVKAAFLYNFAKFVKWPADGGPGKTFVVAVLGEDPFGAVLDRTFAGKTLAERPVEVRRLAVADESADVQLLFVSASERARLPQVLKALEGRSVLTVGELDRFDEKGGMIAFRVRDDVVRFDVNLAELERARLKMSSQLLRLAQRVLAPEGGS